MTIILSMVSLFALCLVGVMANGALGVGPLFGGAVACVAASAAGALAIKNFRGRGYEAWHRQHEQILAEILDRNRR